MAVPARGWGGGPGRRWPRRPNTGLIVGVVAGLVGGVVIGVVAGLVTTASGGVPGAVANDGAAGRTRYAQPVVRCSVVDPRLNQISGMAISRGAFYLVNDTAPVNVWRLDQRRCAVTGRSVLRPPPPRSPGTAPSPGPGGKTIDVEDLAAGVDGALWLADTGGNTSRRTAVSLLRWEPGTSAGQVARYDLRYPDGAHDAEALLISMTGQVVLVTKTTTGVAGVYTSQLPLSPVSTLRRAGDLDLRRLVGGDDLRATVVTGGAVAPDGVHFALRTYTAAFEWDVPDGDIVTALLHGAPRRVPIAHTAQGEALTYAADARGLLTQTERLPAPLGYVAVRRGTTSPLRPTTLVTPGLILGAGASLALGGALAVMAWRRRSEGALGGR